MPKLKNFLPDINVWLALNTRNHVHHQAALAWLEQMGSEQKAYFCRVTQMGFLRLSTQPKVMGKDVETSETAWRAYVTCLEDIRIFFMQETLPLEDAWKALMHRPASTHTAWTDAYLAAFSYTHELEVVTFDRNFPHFDDQNVLVLA